MVQINAEVEGKVVRNYSRGDDATLHRVNIITFGMGTSDRRVEGKGMGE